MSKRVLMVNDGRDMGESYYLPFAFLGSRCDSLTVLDSDPESVALVVFTGGADVSPCLYSEPMCPYTRCDPHRDDVEEAVFKRARHLHIPMFGICRGLQFLTAMNNGKLIQHVTGHTYHNHAIVTQDSAFMVTSSHHQMCVPYEEDEILAWAAPRRSNKYLGIDEPPRLEVEAVRFKDAIGVQYHPEIMPEDSQGFIWVRELIEKHLIQHVDS